MDMFMLDNPYNQKISINNMPEALLFIWEKMHKKKKN